MQVWASATEAWGSSLKGVSTVSNTFSPPQAEFKGHYHRHGEFGYDGSALQAKK